MRVQFSELFSRNRDGSITPKVGVSLNGVALVVGDAYPPSATIGGMVLGDLDGHDLEAELAADGGFNVYKVY